MFDPSKSGKWPAVPPSSNWKLIVTWVIGIISLIGMLVCLVSR